MPLPQGAKYITVGGQQRLWVPNDPMAGFDPNGPGGLLGDRYGGGQQDTYNLPIVGYRQDPNDDGGNSAGRGQIPIYAKPEEYEGGYLLPAGTNFFTADTVDHSGNSLVSIAKQAATDFRDFLPVAGAVVGGAYGAGLAGVPGVAETLPGLGASGVSVTPGAIGAPGAAQTGATTLGSLGDGLTYSMAEPGAEGSLTSTVTPVDVAGAPTYSVLDKVGTMASNPFTWLTAASLGSSLVGANAANNAANVQAGAADRATDANLQMFKTVNDQQAPFRQAGVNAINQLYPNGSTLDPYFTHQFGPDDLKAGLAPNYDFMLEQGLNATKNAGNLQTGLLSGNTIRSVNDYAQNYAGNAYQNAYNNFTNNQNNIFNRLSTIAGFGTNANSQSASTGSSIAGNIGNTITNSGAAQAAGKVGVANAVTGGLTNAASWYALPQIMNGGGGSTSYNPNTYMASLNGQAQNGG
jgi:hypothetical protein